VEETFREVQEIVGTQEIKAGSPEQPVGRSGGKQFRIDIYWTSLCNRPGDWVPWIVLHDATDPAWGEHPSDLIGKQCPSASVNVMIDTYGCYKIDRSIAERQFNERRLFVQWDGRARAEHSSRNITAHRVREVALSQFQKIPAAAANVEPSPRLGIYIGSLQKPLDQLPFPAVEMERITRESIPDRVFE
jgi:hypothetical protein